MARWNLECNLAVYRLSYFSSSLLQGIRISVRAYRQFFETACFGEAILAKSQQLENSLQASFYAAQHLSEFKCLDQGSSLQRSFVAFPAMVKFEKLEVAILSFLASCICSLFCNGVHLLLRAIKCAYLQLQKISVLINFHTFLLPQCCQWELWLIVLDSSQRLHNSFGAAWGSVTVLPCVFGQGDGTSMFWCYMQMMTTMIL